MSQHDCNAINKKSLRELGNLKSTDLYAWLATKSPFLQQHYIKQLAYIN